MKVIGVHDKSGCGWYRVRLPFGELANRGHDVATTSGTVSYADLAGWPLVIGQRMDKHDGLPVWRRLRATSRLVFEIDDDVFTIDPTNTLAYTAYQRVDTRDAVQHAAEVADLVTVTVEPLAEVMRRYNPHVAVLPNCVPDELLTHERPRRDRLVLGWAGGASHAMDLHEVARPVRRFLERNPHVELHLIGTDYRPTLGCGGRFTAWDADPWGYYRNIDFDIGIAPLVDTPFARSTSATAHARFVDKIQLFGFIFMVFDWRIGTSSVCPTTCTSCCAISFMFKICANLASASFARGFTSVEPRSNVRSDLNRIIPRRSSNSSMSGYISASCRSLSFTAGGSGLGGSSSGLGGRGGGARR